MDLDNNQALKMVVKDIAGAEYLFVETGGFGKRNKRCWKPSSYVLERL